jgi:hypothetical protein
MLIDTPLKNTSNDAANWIDQTTCESKRTMISIEHKFEVLDLLVCHE